MNEQDKKYYQLSYEVDDELIKKIISLEIEERIKLKTAIRKSFNTIIDQGEVIEDYTKEFEIYNQLLKILAKLLTFSDGEGFPAVKFFTQFYRLELDINYAGIITHFLNEYC